MEADKDAQNYKKDKKKKVEVDNDNDVLSSVADTAVDLIEIAFDAGDFSF